MRLLVTTAWYPNPVHPTDGNFIQKLVELVADTHDVTVLCVVGDPEYAPSTPWVDEQQELSGRVLRVTYGSKGNRLQRILKRRRAWKMGLQRVGREFDLVHGYILVDGGIMAWRAARAISVPFLLLEQSTRWHRPWPLLRHPELWLARAAAKRAKFVLTITTALQQSMRRAGVKANYRVLSNVVHQENFYPPTTVAPIANRPFRWLHVSDDSPKKRIDLLFSTFFQLLQTHPDISLTIAGLKEPAEVRDRALRLYDRQFPPGALRDWCFETDTLGLRLFGDRPSAEIGELMRTADAFALTSDLETQSVVVLEAQFSGLPTVTTRCGGPETILETTGGGVIVEVDDNVGLLDAMRTLTEAGPATAQERAALAEITQYHYSAAAIRSRLLTYYKEAIDA